MNLRGLGITNTISRSELAAVAAAIIQRYSHIATDSLTSKQLSHPNLHRHHIQGDVLQSIAKSIHQSPSPIRFHKVKSHADTIGNEYADALARKSITTYSDVADTFIKTASPEGNSFYNIYWLAKEYEEHQINKINQTQPSHLPQGFGLWYLSNYHDALQAHMHPLHKLGNANTVANYHEYYQTLIKNGMPMEPLAMLNAYLRASYSCHC